MPALKGAAGMGRLVNCGSQCGARCHAACLSQVSAVSNGLAGSQWRQRLTIVPVCSCLYSTRDGIYPVRC